MKHTFPMEEVKTVKTTLKNNQLWVSSQDFDNVR